MRTTVTLDPDAELIVRTRMRERGQSFKEALNDLIRLGARRERSPEEPFRTPVASLGVPTVNLDRALQLVGDLEDEERLRRMRAGS